MNRTTYYPGIGGRPTIDKGQDESLPYSWDFEDLLPDGEAIATVAAIDLETPLALVGSAQHDSSHVTAQISGGALDKHQRATCRITTAPGGFTISRSIWLHIVCHR